MWLLWGCVYLPEDAMTGLEPGDVRAVVRVDTGGGFTPREGARAVLRGAPRAVLSGGDGRITLRNVPTGQHGMDVTLDTNGDGVPELGRQVAFRMTERQGTRARVDLGNVDLGKVGVLRGSVRVEVNGACPETALPPAGTVVALELEDRLVPVDAAGEFVMEGVLPGSHRVMAAAAGVLSQVESVDVGEAADMRLARTLCLRGSGGPLDGPLPGRLLPAPGEEDVPLPERIPVSVLRAAGSGAAAVTADAAGAYEVTGLEPSIYALSADPGEDYLPVRVAWVFVDRGTRRLPDAWLYLRNEQDPGPSSGVASSGTTTSGASSLGGSSSVPSSSSSSSSSSASSEGASSSSSASIASSGVVPSSNGSSSSVAGSGMSGMASASSSVAGVSSSAATASSQVAPVTPVVRVVSTPGSPANTRTLLPAAVATTVHAWTLSLPAGAPAVNVQSLVIRHATGATGTVTLLEDLGTAGTLDGADTTLSTAPATEGLSTMNAGRTLQAGTPLRLLLVQQTDAGTTAPSCRPVLETPHINAVPQAGGGPVAVDLSGLASPPVLQCVTAALQVEQLRSTAAPIDIPSASPPMTMVRLRMRALAQGPLTASLSDLVVTTNQGSPSGNVTLVRDLNRDGRFTAADEAIQSLNVNSPVNAPLVFQPFSVTGTENILLASTIAGTSASYLLNAGFRVTAMGALVDQPAAYVARMTSTFARTFNDMQGTYVNLPGVTAEDAAMADVDGDGLVDMVLLQDDGRVLLIRGTDIGVLDTVATELGSTGLQGRMLRVADMNRDSRADVVVVGTDRLVVLVARADGTFSAEPAFSVTLPGEPAGVELADIQRNGHVDVLLAIPSLPDLYVVGNARVQLETPLAIPARPGLRSVVAADMTRDGALDLVVNGPGHLSVMGNTGTGFMELNAWNAGMMVPNASPPWVADVDTDGLLDVVDLGINAGSATVYRATTTPNIYTTALRSLASSEPPLHASAADTNGDRFPDLLVLHDGPGTPTSNLLVHAGQATSPWVGAQVSGNRTNGTPVAAFSHDLTLDGDPDQLAVVRTATGSAVRFADADTLRAGGTRDAAGLGVINSATTVGGTGAATTLALADFNRDARLDVLRITGVPGRMEVLLGGGTENMPTFTGSTDATPGDNGVGAVADINADGWPDVVVAVPGMMGAELHTWLNTRADGLLMHAGSVPLGTAFRAVAVRAEDVTHDGYPDVVVAVAEPDELVLVGNNAGMLMGVSAVPLPRAVVALELADVRGPMMGPRDGVVDAVLLAADRLVVVPLSGLGAAGMAVESTALFTGALSMVAGDISRDGFPDVAVVQGNSEVRVLRGQRTGMDVFLPETTGTCGTGNTAWADITLADMDRDADVDVVVTTYTSTGLCVLGNLDPARLRLAVPSAADGTEAFRGAGHKVVAGDFNRDGDVDVLGAVPEATFHAWYVRGQ